MNGKWLRILSYADIPGGVILGLLSLEMIAIIAYYACSGKELPGTVRDVYGIVVGAFAATNVAKYYGQKGTKNELPKAE
jgi:hypothetical protein